MHFSYLQTGNYKMARLNEAKVYREVNDGVDEHGLTPLQKLKRKKINYIKVTNIVISFMFVHYILLIMSCMYS